MTIFLEYHDVVNCSARRSLRRWIPAWFALCGMFCVPLFNSSASAQINAAGSVRTFGVAPPTATRVAPPTATTVPPPTGVSFARGGFASSGVGFGHSTGISHLHHPQGNNSGHSARHNVNGTAYYPYVYAVPVPYAVDVTDAQGSDDQNAQNGGDPSGADTASAQNEADPPERAAMADADPEPPQPPTTLVFKDGHQLEVNNYAIVSQTLYDLTPGHPRKIALADIDIAATEKQNDDHGVVFLVPSSSQAN